MDPWITNIVGPYGWNKRPSIVWIHPHSGWIGFFYTSNSYFINFFLKHWILWLTCDNFYLLMSLVFLLFIIVSFILSTCQLQNLVCKNEVDKMIVPSILPFFLFLLFFILQLTRQIIVPIMLLWHPLY